MTDILPRVIEIKLAAEPRRSFLCIQGVDELAAMARLPKGLPKGAVAHQFLSDFNNGKLKPKPVLFGAKVSVTVKNS
jgi:hypothetical protein